MEAVNGFPPPHPNPLPHWGRGEKGGIDLMLPSIIGTTLRQKFLQKDIP
jgi:hypothetical protein